MTVQPAACRRRRDPVRGPIDEFDTDLALQGQQLLAQCGLSNADLRRCLGNASSVDDRDKIAESAKIHANPPVRDPLWRSRHFLIRNPAGAVRGQSDVYHGRHRNAKLFEYMITSLSILRD